MKWSNSVVYIDRFLQPSHSTTCSLHAPICSSFSTSPLPRRPFRTHRLMAALNSLLAPHSLPSKTPRSFPSPLSPSFHHSVLRLSSSIKNARLHCHASASSSAAAVVTEAEPDAAGEREKFDWFAHWYPVAPICDLDKRRPHAKTVMGLDLVVWWDRTKGQWQVFDDRCPHRLAPLSEGRIDPWGRLQCVYHGWCFDGSGSCKYIPQAPDDGPPVSNFACPTILLCSAVEISLLVDAFLRVYIVWIVYMNSPCGAESDEFAA